MLRHRLSGLSTSILRYSGPVGDLLLHDEIPGSLRSTITQCILEELYSLLILNLVALVQVIKNVTIPLNEHL